MAKYKKSEILELLNKDAIATLPSCQKKQDEKQTTYDACLLYLGMGEERNFEDVAELSRRTVKSIETSAKDYNWKKRASDYDKFCCDQSSGDDEFQVILDKLDKNAILNVESCAQRKDEASHHYKYFCIYLALEEGRKVEKVAKLCKKSISTIYILCGQYDWVDRAKEYDHFCMAVILKEMANMRIRRKIQTLQKKWEISEALEAKALEMLATPLRKTRDEDGNVIEGARWKMEDAAKFLDLSSRLRSESVDEPKIDILEAVKVLSDNGLLPAGVAEAAALEIQEISDRIKTKMANQ